VTVLLGSEPLADDPADNVKSLLSCFVLLDLESLADALAGFHSLTSFDEHTFLQWR